MKFISFFAGVGGFDLGLERAGHECVGQVEINPFCIKVLEKHWPQVWRHDDITTLKPEDIPEADMWAGGFPCTQTSFAAAIQGKRTGFAGKESGLWFEFWLRIRHSVPRWVVVENVLGVTTWETEITRRLEGIGYRVSRLSISAARVGAPDLRRRVFYVANADGQGLEIAGPEGSPTIASLPWRAVAGDDWDAIIPRDGRVEPRIPDRVDRIKALGNAVVPAVAKYIGKLLNEV